MVFVPVQNLSEIVWTQPKNKSLLQTWFTKKFKSNAEGMPRQNIPTDARGRANFLGTVKARNKKTKQLVIVEMWSSKQQQQKTQGLT